MYEIIRQVILNGGYKLTDMQGKIKRMYVRGDLTEEQMDELLVMVNGGANPNAERPDTLEMLKSISARLDKVEAKLNALENSGTQPEEYPAWTPWDGVSNNYQPGAIVAHNEKLWQSVFEGQNVWEPGTVSFWVDYTEEA